jgi:hypothetical protein
MNGWMDGYLFTLLYSTLPIRMEFKFASMYLIYQWSSSPILTLTPTLTMSITFTLTLIITLIIGEFGYESNVKL